MYLVPLLPLLPLVPLVIYFHRKFVPQRNYSEPVLTETAVIFSADPWSSVTVEVQPLSGEEKKEEGEAGEEEDYWIGLFVWFFEKDIPGKDVAAALDAWSPSFHVSREDKVAKLMHTMRAQEEKEEQERKRRREKKKKIKDEIDNEDDEGKIDDEEEKENIKGILSEERSAQIDDYLAQIADRKAKLLAMQTLVCENEAFIEERKKIIDNILGSQCTIRIGFNASHKARTGMREEDTSSSLNYGEILFRTFARALHKLKIKYGGWGEILFLLYFR